MGQRDDTGQNQYDAIKLGGKKITNNAPCFMIESKDDTGKLIV